MYETLWEKLIYTDEAVQFDARTSPAQLVYWYPQGQTEGAKWIRAHILQEREPGNNQVVGDGVVLNEDQGYDFRKSIRIGVPTSLGIDQNNELKDKFRVFERLEEVRKFTVTADTTLGIIYTLKRRLKTDYGIQLFLAVSVEKRVQRPERRQG